MSMTTARLRPLPPIAARVDAELAQLDMEVDWLLALSPIDNDALRRAFENSGRRSLPALHYHDPVLDLRATRERLLALPVDDIESPLLSGLLAEKQREIDRQIELIRLRDTDGFVNASLDLFGGVEPPLLDLAETILNTVDSGPPLPADAGIDEVLAATEAELDWYRQRAPDFTAEVVVDVDLNSWLMVSHGVFYINGGIRLPQARVQPLIQHEVGTHIVTRHNGRQQALKQLEVGLAHYDALQEGLGVLAEFVAGYLPAQRLRVLAARVVAVELAIHGEAVPAIFDHLHHTLGLDTEDAFDVAVRAVRGGGLTKDAVYLRGLRDLLDHLRHGADFEPLFAGKFALSHLVVLDQLIEADWVAAPELLPRYCHASEFQQQLERCRTLDIDQLFHKEPQA